MIRILPLLLVCTFLVACVSPAAQPGAVPSPSPDQTETSTPSPTATVVWFPATSTFTPYPTRQITPTTDMQPGLGEVLLSDDFSNPDNWELARNGQGSVALGKKEITIAIGEDRAYLYSLRRGTSFGNAYIEITASPSLCRGQDEYGMLLRAAGKNDYYRFSLSCDGQARLDRLADADASSPQPWVTSGAVPPGAPSVSRLAAWMVGSEMRFFVNDEYLFTVRDPLFPSGSVGVFARSTGEFAVTVNFSNLVIRKINP